MPNLIKHIQLISLLMALLSIFAISCTDDQASSPVEEDETVFRLVVNEVPWENENMQVTRSDASMLEDLKDANATGFGLYCPEFKLTNQQVTWDGTNSRWNYGYTLLWSIKKSQTINLYAYAPYWAYTTYADKTIEYDLAYGIDLRWASQEGATRTDDNNGVITLNFQHALGKLAFGILTNNYGRDITLTNICVTGTPYQTGTLSLVDGSWSNLTAYGSSQTFINQDLSLDIDNEATESIGDYSCLLIPGSTVTVTLTFSSTDFGTETVSFDMTLPTTTNTQTTLNITITNNFEVVISN